MATDGQTVPVEGRRERRKRETRQALLAAARALIAEGGPGAVRITTVVEEADVGFGTFYTYFESKDALIEAVISDAMTQTANIIGTRALESSDDPAETASIAYRRFLAYGAENSELAAVLVSLPEAEQLFETALAPTARRTLERGIANGRFDIDDVELALTSVSAAALAAIRAITTGRVESGADVRGAVMMLRAFGLSNEEAREIAARPLPDIEITEEEDY